ncbi:MAG: hypothetical protein ABW136_06835 [Steroidobacteraceae bacterium]
MNTHSPLPYDPLEETVENPDLPPLSPPLSLSRLGAPRRASRLGLARLRATLTVGVVLVAVAALYLRHAVV